MSGYTKIFSSLVDSTVWRESKETKIVWITMLAKSDRYGHVEASVPGLADAAKVTLPECLEALKVLMDEDEWSRTKEHGGRRIQEIDGGWLILNHTKYRDKMSAEDRLERQRLWQESYRKRKKEVKEAAVQGGAQQAIKEALPLPAANAAELNGGQSEPLPEVEDPVTIRKFGETP